MNEPCCKRPAIVRMDHQKCGASDNWHKPRQMVNRVCTSCWTHWYGEEGEVKQYTKAEWDAHVEGAA